jgi:hypothetical protein
MTCLGTVGEEFKVHGNRCLPGGLDETYTAPGTGCGGYIEERKTE